LVLVWVDNADPTAWFYLAVQEATNSHAAQSREGATVPGMGFEFERWIGMMNDPDWIDLEGQWRNENDPISDEDDIPELEPVDDGGDGDDEEGEEEEEDAGNGGYEEEAEANGEEA